MKREEILSKFRDVCDEPYTWLSNWKETNKKPVVACYPLYVPEEIIHAGGALPFVIQRSRERMLFSHRYFTPYMCDFVRSTVDLVLKGTLDFIDGMVRANTCHINQGLACILQMLRPNLYQRDLHMALELEKDGPKKCVLEELERFTADFGKLVGREIDDKTLWRSIGIYNEHRKLVRRVFELRREKPGLLSGREMQYIVRSSMLMPKEEHIEYLNHLLPELEKARPAADGKLRLFVSGTLCEDTPVEILDLLEDLGGVIVDDDLYMGARYVAPDCEPAANALDSLTQRYFNMLPCPTRYKALKDDYSDYVTRRARSCGAQGVIITLVLHCEPHYYSYARQKNVLEKAGLPQLLIEMEQESLSIGRLRTRMGAFMEMVKGGY